MAVNTYEIWSNGIKITFFPKTYKNRPAAEGFAPKPPLPPEAGENPPHPVCDTFEYTNFLNTSPKLGICAF